MLYIPKFYLKILTDDEVKDFVINFGEYFKSTREKLHSKLSKEQNLRKFADLLYIFLTAPHEVEKYIEMMQSSSSDDSLCHYNIKILNLFDMELQLINTKLIIKNKSKELLRELKKFKVQSILFLEYKNRNDHEIFHLSIKVTASDPHIDETFKSMH